MKCIRILTLLSLPFILRAENHNNSFPQHFFNDSPFYRPEIPNNEIPPILRDLSNHERYTFIQEILKGINVYLTNDQLDELVQLTVGYSQYDLLTKIFEPLQEKNNHTITYNVIKKIIDNN